MKTIPLQKILLVLFLGLVLISCSPAISRGASVTETVQMDESDSDAADLIISDLEFVWPEPVPPNPCQENFPAPEISLCIQNQGSTVESPELAYFSLPACLVPGALEHIMISLPGGSWMQPETIFVTGFPGVLGEKKAVMLENKYPENFGGIHKIIIISKLPESTDETVGDQIVLLIFPGTEGAGNIASGVALELPPGILPGDVGFGQEMGIITEVFPGVDGFSDLYTIEILPLPVVSSVGKIWGEFIWGGEIFHSGESQEIIPVLMPTPDDNEPPPDDSTHGIIWGGIVWGGVVQDDKIADAGWTGFPPDFDIGSMLPKMGDGGYDSNPYIFGSIQLQYFDFPAELDPGQTSCITVPVILPEVLGVETLVPIDLAQFAINGNSPGAAEIDFLALTIQENVGSDGNITRIVKIPPLPYTRCTPDPEIATVIPSLATPTPTPTRKVIPPPPTPTTRTGLPTKTPTGRPAPTKTPIPPSRNN